MALFDSTQIEYYLQEHKKFFNTGKTKALSFRLEQLKVLKKAVLANEKDITRALYRDLHKPAFEAYSSEIGYVLDSINYTLKHLPDWAKIKKVPTPFYHIGASSFIQPEPYGTVLIIGPYNYPFNLVIDPLIGAIAAGNCAVIKPSESTPYTAEIINKIITENFAADFIRVLEGEKEETSILINSPFDYIFFTGSAAVGKIIMAAASKNLIPVTLELGGKSPAIIDKTANLDIAARRVVWGKFFNAGQTCIAPDYLLVNKEIKDSFLEKLIVTIEKYYGKDAYTSPDYARIVNSRQTERLIRILQHDKDKIFYGGNYLKEEGFIEPTILNNADWDDAAMADEIFGPILPILDYTDNQAVISMLNQHPRPLAIYVFTEDKNTAQTFLEQTSSGGACINDTLSHYASSYLPFGGIGNSGMGSYHGKNSFDTFTHYKSIMKKTSKLDISFLFPPYKNKLKWLKKILY